MYVVFPTEQNGTQIYKFQIWAEIYLYMHTEYILNTKYVGYKHYIQEGKQPLMCC
jgi:hypothetical protein